ncbi:MAG: fumarylacetoacetase [Cyanobacteria bacterium P01_F01_bin.53]
MTYLPDETHDPHLRSWIASANGPATDFPVQNLPLSIFKPLHSTAAPRIGVAIGDQILDLYACGKTGLLQGLPEPLQQACSTSTLNALMGLGEGASHALRHRLSQLLQINTTLPRDELQILVSMAESEMLLPATIGDYTDFYASIFHATNVGKLFRPNNPLLPNYKHLPIAYHGRASSLTISGTSIHLPLGQQQPADEGAMPGFDPSQRLDYEMEVGLFVGQGNELGMPIGIGQAESHLFGLCLVNDWSARDIQAWEYQPLGPFLGKSFATSLSPWVVTTEALVPFRCPAYGRADDDPTPLPYLSSLQNTEHGGIEITVEVWMSSARMRKEAIAPIRLSQANFAQMYWTAAQMITHHTSNGCNLRPGDLLASGTVSGPEVGAQGSLLEITQQGRSPIELPSGETRTFLTDGDEVILRGYCEKAGYTRIGFGDCRGQIIGQGIVEGRSGQQSPTS